MKIDALSGWATAPAAARLVGDGEAFRVFDTAEEALTFLAETSRVAINQRLYRQRKRKGVSVIPVPIADEVLAALLDGGRLDDARSMDRKPQMHQEIYGKCSHNRARRYG
jgi:hypothetical protein